MIQVGDKIRLLDNSYWNNKYDFDERAAFEPGTEHVVVRADHTPYNPYPVDIMVGAVTYPLSLREVEKVNG